MRTPGNSQTSLIAVVLSWICVLAWLLPALGIPRGCRKDGQLAPLDFSVPEGSERVCLSLRVLQATVSSSLANGSPLPEECRTLAGIGFLEGYLAQHGEVEDVVLVGLRSESRPHLTLDDLLVGMRSAGQPLNYPYCSLDPLPEHTRALREFFAGSGASGSTGGTGDFLDRVKAAAGPQKVVIRGVPRNSRHAHVMVDADYHMKEVCQGRVGLPGVASHLDRFLNATGAGALPGSGPRGSTMSMARFWFQVGADSPRYREAKGSVWLAQCQVIIRTEKQQATPSGELYDAAEDDPLAVAFADDLSKAFDSVTAIVPAYAELENLYRLRAVLLAMRFRAALSLVGVDWDSYLREYTFREERPMEPTLPCLANWKAQSGRCAVVCGGVGMGMTVDAGSFRSSGRNDLFAFRQALLEARPSKDSLWWVVQQLPRPERKR